ncbi:MAG: hypothetical protein IPQ04_14695 [Saprospiraceae bacterium]|nr:hypothetical protein [Saprospiraceae bacterium]
MSNRIDTFLYKAQNSFHKKIHSIYTIQYKLDYICRERGMIFVIEKTKRERGRSGHEVKRMTRPDIVVKTRKGLAQN